MPSVKKRIISLFAFFFITILSIPIYVKFKARNKIFAKIENVRSAEFVIVLGAAIKTNGQPGNYLKERLNDAIMLYNNGKVAKILVSGDNESMAHDEISVMNNYLVQNDIPQNKIFGDYAGFDTYSTMERAAKLFNIDNAIIVSQGFHLPRSLYIANQKGINAIGFATKQSLGRRKYFIRESLATIKSFFDCFIKRKSKFYGKPIDTDNGTNIKLEQLNSTKLD